MSENLPPAILRLTLKDARPIPPVLVVRAADMLAWTARDRECMECRTWTSVEWAYRWRPNHIKRHRLRGARLLYQKDAGIPPLGVGKVKAVWREGSNSRAGAWWAMVDGEPLRHKSVIVLFSSAERAQSAAVLALATQSCTGVLPEVLKVDRVNNDFRPVRG
jgi:hypothetical protein